MAYSGRYQNPLGCSDRAFGGAGLNLGIEALGGDTDMVWTFDDFNGRIQTEGFGDAAFWETTGWVLTADAGGSTGSAIGMNDATAVASEFDSCIKILSATAEQDGGQMQLDLLNGAVAVPVNMHTFPHIWIPETGAGVAALDNTIWVFATRVGLSTGDTTDGDWDHAAFIGWAEAGDTSLLVNTTGVMDDADGSNWGFHFNLTGCIDGISKRIPGDSMVEGTNWTRLGAAGTCDGTLANGATVIGDTMWFDLALRIKITDQSDDAANGQTDFYWRRVPSYPQAPGERTHAIGGDSGSWVHHGTVLTNETPNNDIILVPTIETINGNTAGDDMTFYVDWWTMGCSRYSRRVTTEG
jgi:hypothetical protein